ncbi:MAG: hypothetical protein MET45_05455 [Nostoc sp. LLA-1]|nr:hypothetical protein [Cyanocohniella sp. LLY]
MEKYNQTDKNSFLYPRSRYYGTLKPANLVFNANLQEFSQKIGYVTALETSGKLSPEEAYKQIEGLWQDLQSSYHQLAISNDSSANV